MNLAMSRVRACAALPAVLLTVLGPSCEIAIAQEVQPQLMPALVVPGPGQTHITIQLFVENATGDVKDFHLVVGGGPPGGVDCNGNDPELTCQGLQGYTVGTRRKIEVITTQKSTCVTLIMGGTARSFCR